MAGGDGGRVEVPVPRLWLVMRTHDPRASVSWHRCTLPITCPLPPPDPYCKDTELQGGFLTHSIRDVVGLIQAYASACATTKLARVAELLQRSQAVVPLERPDASLHDDSARTPETGVWPRLAAKVDALVAQLTALRTSTQEHDAVVVPCGWTPKASGDAVSTGGAHAIVVVRGTTTRTMSRSFMV